MLIAGLLLLAVASGGREFTWNHVGDVTSMGFSKDAKTILLFGRGGFESRDADSPALRVHSAWLAKGSSGLSLDALHLRCSASLPEGEGIEVRDLPSGKPLSRIPLPEEPLRSIFAPDGKTLAILLWDEVMQYECSTGRRVGRTFNLKSISSTGEPKGLGIGNYQMAYSPSSSELAISRGYDVCCLRVRDFKVICRLRGNRERVDAIAYSPDGKRIATASWDGFLRMWNPLTGKLQYSTRLKEGLGSSLGFSKDGSLLAVGRYPRRKYNDKKQGHLSIYLASDCRLVRDLVQPSGVTAVCFFPRGRKVAFARSGGLVGVVDLGILGDVVRSCGKS